MTDDELIEVINEFCDWAIENKVPPIGADFERGEKTYKNNIYFLHEKRGFPTHKKSQ